MQRTRPFECPECGRISMGVVAPSHLHEGRPVASREVTELRLPPEPLDSLQAQVDRLEPGLRQTLWYPMTYLAIPGLLGSADLLLLEIEAYDGPEKERAAALHARLEALRTGFHRDPCPPPGEAPKGG